MVALGNMNTWHPLLESVGDAVCLVDIDRSVLKCNSSMASFLRKETDEIVGHKCHDVMCCGARAAGECVIGLAKKSGHREERIVRNGDRTFRVSAEPIFDDQGIMTKAFHVISEIPVTPTWSESQHASGNGHDSEDARKLASLGLASGAVAHDFNNLLTGILGYSDLALCMTPEESNIRGHLAQIKASALQGAALINNLMDRASAERFPKKPMRISSLVNSVVQELASKVPENVELRRVIASHIPDVEVNQTQMRQMVTNLLLNAIEAVGEREGTVTVSAYTMDCSRALLDGTMHGSSLPEGRYLCIEVADTGTGMDEETMARATQLFFSTKPSGYGLGLTAVERSVKQHEGTMRISSTSGVGTRIQVFLPIVRDSDNTLHSCTGQQGAPLQA